MEMSEREMYPAGQHILVIESEVKRRQQAERILADEGFAVLAVAEGLSAVRAAAAGRYALAVVGVQLPGSLDGVATLRQIRVRQPGLRALYTGAATARPARLDRERDEFIAAPFVRRELLGCVFELLQRGRLRPAAAGGLGRAG